MYVLKKDETGTWEVLTCGYPPSATALTSVNFSSADIASFNTGGVRKSVCKTSLLDDARVALGNKAC